MIAIVANLLLASFMTGLIWFVQVVHYPLFAMVDGPGSSAYAARHQAATTWVVGPVMLAELVVAIWLAVAPPSGVPAWIPRVALGLLVVVWLSTALWQVPLHQRLLGGHDGSTIASLVAGNWIRTAAWTARAILGAWMAWILLRPLPTP